MAALIFTAPVYLAQASGAFRRMLVEDTSANMASEAALIVSALIFAAAATAGAGLWLLFGTLR